MPGEHSSLSKISSFADKADVNDDYDELLKTKLKVIDVFGTQNAVRTKKPPRRTKHGKSLLIYSVDLVGSDKCALI